MSDQSLTQDLLQELFKYDPETGILSNRVDRGTTGKKGTPITCRDQYGYIKLGVNGKDYLAHRIIWLYVHGEFPPHQIDHINRDKGDNRISNLRAVTNQTNHRNKAIQSNNTSGSNGVYWCKRSKRWVGNIKLNGASKHLGSFKEKNDAIAAREKANIEYGFHPNHGK